MPTLMRVAGYRIVIFTNDHSPAHVHLLKANARAKILLGDMHWPPQVVEVRGIGLKDLRKMMDVVCEHQMLLLEKWEEIHG